MYKWYQIHSKNALLDRRFKSAISKSDEFYFTLRAGNGETLGISEMYSSSSARDKGITAVMREVPKAGLEDLTLTQGGPEDDHSSDQNQKKDNQKENTLNIVIRDPNTFVGKPIKEFKTSFDAESAVKVYVDSYDPEEPITARLDNLANLPGADQIDTLVIGSWEEVYDNKADFIVEKLIQLKNKFKSIKHLFVGDMTYEDSEISWIRQADYSNFWKHYPDLESFGAKGGNELILGKIELPNLKHLILETGGLSGKVIEDLNKSDLPNLEYLELWLGTDEYGSTVEISHLKSILNCKFPKLKYLGLKNYYLADDLAKALQGAPTLEGIQTLDVSMGTITDAGAKALYENKALLDLKYINCRHHFISDEWMTKLQTKFADQNINLADQIVTDDDWYYVEIGE